MAMLVTGIGELVTGDPTLPRIVEDGATPAALGLLRAAAFVVEAGRIAWVGAAADAPDADWRVDLEGRAVVPGFVDAHTELPPGDGGHAALRSAIADAALAMRRQGTTTITMTCDPHAPGPGHVETLRLAHEATEEVAVRVGAGASSEALAAASGLARWVEVGSRPGPGQGDQRRGAVADLDVGEAVSLLRQARRAGFGARVSASTVAAATVAVEQGAAALVGAAGGAEADVLASGPPGSEGAPVAVLLPAVSFVARTPYPRARALLDAGVPVALGTAAHTGAAYTTSMPFLIALAVRELGLTPAEALLAATTGGARALRREDVGRLVAGARADVAALEAPSYVALADRPGVPLAQALDLGA